MALIKSCLASGGDTVYWSNPTTGENFAAQDIVLSRPCKKVCVVWGTNNTSINVDAETITNQYAAGGNLIDGVFTLERGETKYADQSGNSRGKRDYTLSADGTKVVIGASTYQASYQTPCLIFSLE